MISRLRRIASLGAAAICVVGLAVPAASQADVVFGANPSTKLEVTASNDPVSLSTSSKPAYEAYSITFTNQDSRNLSHGSLVDTLPSGSSLVSATSSVGSCSSAGGKVTCTLGQLNAGDVVTAFIVIQTPSSGSDVLNTVSVNFDERINDKPGADPKQDTVILPLHTAVAPSGSASTYVPANTGVDISTDPTGKNVASSGDPEVADANVPPQSNALTARLLETTGAFTCPSGAVCRGGGWVQATIPGSFFPPLGFFLRWDKTLIDSGQTTKNFQLYYRTSLDSGDLEIISNRCSSATPLAIELPCLWNVTKEKDGDFDGVLFNNHNGYMR